MVESDAAAAHPVRSCMDCGHGRLKRDCAVCSDCGHASIKSSCLVCSNCGASPVVGCQWLTRSVFAGHNKVRKNCSQCYQSRATAKARRAKRRLDSGEEEADGDAADDSEKEGPPV